MRRHTDPTMAIDPVFSPPVLPEPAPQRPRASDARDGSAEFTLPERRDDKPAPAQDSPRRAADPAAKPDAPPRHDQKVEDGKAPSQAANGGDSATATPSPAEGTEAKPAGAVVRQPDAADGKAALPINDIGTLASLIVAAQDRAAETQAVQTPATATPATDPTKAVTNPAMAAVAQEAESTILTPGKKKPGEETEAAAEASAGPTQQAAVAPADPGLLALMTAAAATPAAAPASQPNASATAAVAAKGQSASGAAGPADAVAAPIGGNAALILGAGPGDGGQATTGANAAALLEAAQGGKVSAEGKASADGKIPADGKASAPSDPGATSATSQPAAEAAARSESLQQILAPIDLSGLTAHAAGKAQGHPQAAPAVQDPAASTTQLQQAQAGAGAPTPLHVVPIEIGMRALAGAKRFDIRLDPAELGRIDVNLSISDKGEVHAKLVVDRVETLHLLQRDARTLERAFEQAGLKPSDSGVDISLRDDSGQAFRQQRPQDEAPQRQRRGRAGDEADDAGTIAVTAAQPQRRIMRLGGVDLSI